MSDTKQYLVNGRAVTVREGGQNNMPAVLLLHGGAGDATLHWGKVFSMLSDSLHVIAPDLPAFGGSAPLPTLTTQALLAWLDALLLTLEVEQVIVVGNGLGATLARLFAANMPHRVSALVLLNGGTIPNPPPLMRRLAQTPVINSLLFQYLAQSASSSSHYASSIAPQNLSLLDANFYAATKTAQSAFAALMRTFIGSPLPEQLNPKQPTLLLWGTSDTVNTLTEAQRIQRAIPQSTLIEISECGQMPQLEAPDVFCWQLKRFIQLQENPRHPHMPGVQRLG